MVGCKHSSEGSSLTRLYKLDDVVVEIETSLLTWSGLLELDLGDPSRR